MVEITLLTFWLFYTCMVCFYLANLRISHRFDSSRCFQSVSLACSLLTISVSIAFKLHSSALPGNPHANAATAALGFILTLKFLELSFAQEWIYTRAMPLKLVLIYLITFPRMPESIVNLAKWPTGHVRYHSMETLLKGIAEYCILRIVLSPIPTEWLSISSISLSPAVRLFRYGLLCIVLYLLLTFCLNIMFGLAGLVFNAQMNPMFPAFPLTATSLRDFWSYRWNNYVKSSLHRISFLVAPKLLSPVMTMNKKASGLFASALSGLFHEYIAWFITNRWSGKNMIFFLLQGLLVRLEIAMKLPSRPATLTGKFLGWLWTLAIILVTSPLFFDPWIEAGLFINLK